MGNPPNDSGAPDDLDRESAGERDSEQEDRAAILKRRASFVASAIAGLSLATFASACEPTPCLDYAPPEGGTGGTAGTGGDCAQGGAGGATGGTGGDCGTTSTQ
ncbi:MAG: hypothetical protein R3B70_02050 [Polyangiaceae bacterium]